ncbi:phage antirepressor KilAC domain-containing protein [Pseudomonas sp. NPDC089406]|uniref:phage antirepressor KilAC domain-containing protein n=1 Tax=Pseudomonas sp. NPDC089406 TaxID=3364463 RepID=UPI00384B7879
MTVVNSTDTPLTMSSLEIADLTGKNHADVMRDIKKMVKALGEGGDSRFAGSYVSAQNKQLPCFDLPRRETDILLTGYSTPMRAVVIDRWRELEAQVAKPVANLNDPAALRGLLLSYTEQVMKLEAKVAEDEPKVDYYSQVRDAKNTQTIGDFAKVLGFGRNKLFKWLREQNILMGDNKPQQRHIDEGHFRVLDKTRKDEDGKKFTYTQTVLTGKGKTYVQKRLKKAGNPDLGEDD